MPRPMPTDYGLIPLLSYVVRICPFRVLLVIIINN